MDGADLGSRGRPLVVGRGDGDHGWTGVDRRGEGQGGQGGGGGCRFRADVDRVVADRLHRRPLDVGLVGDAVGAAVDRCRAVARRRGEGSRNHRHVLVGEQDDTDDPVVEVDVVAGHGQ